jgi:7,8-dihydropterin-6-yl-methyl-4-(beta-D-ribofuranosyl)aminobenzene 5'-phosphate synthase
MRVICVVDDAVQRGSAFWGEHGLAFLIETEGFRVLFDTGQSGSVLLRNLKLLEVEPATIDAVAISHGHYDHTGGLQALLEHLRPGTPLFASPDLFRERFSCREGSAKNAGISLSKDQLARSLELSLSEKPQEIVSGVWTTGEIRQRPEPEGSSNHHLMREGSLLVADAYRDDMALVLQKGHRLALLCGCCHAGLLNTLAHVQREFDGPVAYIIGGLHLTSASDGALTQAGNVLSALAELVGVYPNHCTGEAAFVSLTQTCGASSVQPCPAGTVLEF